jgi:hypothetical protein
MLPWRSHSPAFAVCVCTIKHGPLPGASRSATRCKGCDSRIKRLAKELGVVRYKVYVPEHLALKGGKTVKPKTAYTIVFQGGNAGTRSNSSTPRTSGVRGSAAPDATPRLTRRRSAPSRGELEVEFPALVDT